MSLRGAIALAAGLVLIALCVTAQRAPAVLLRWHDRTAVDPGADLFVVFNPVRDRAPERAAQQLLTQLQSGRCTEVLAFLDHQRRSAICEREATYRALSWTLRDREQGADSTRVFFDVYRAPLPASLSNVSITLRRTSGGWVAVEYDCWY